MGRALARRIGPGALVGALAFALGLVAKPMVVTLPFLLAAGGEAQP